MKTDPYKIKRRYPPLSKYQLNARGVVSSETVTLFGHAEN